MAQFTNQAFLSYNDIVTPSNVAVGELLEVLSATKTAVSSTYQERDSVTYIVSILNSGNTAYNALSISDNLGSYSFNSQTLTPLSYVDGSLLYYINGVLQPTPTVTTEAPLVVSGISVPANGNAIIVYEAQITAFAPLSEGSTITNIVTVSGNNIVPFDAEETITVSNDAVMSITKSISPIPVSENSLVNYTFVIQNTGNAPLVATDNAIISDVFDPILSNISVTFNGALWQEGVNYTYNETTGEFTTIAGQVLVDAATFEQNPQTGAWTATPGVATLIVTGTI
ncbi:MAG: hypothetical protein J6B60_03020 [Clostridia bacterium]|nr:hypothetical protein [Clostridia bacterium]